MNFHHWKFQITWKIFQNMRSLLLDKQIFASSDARLCRNQGLVKGAKICFRYPYFYFWHGESTSTVSQLTSPASKKSKDLNSVLFLLQDLGCNTRNDGRNMHNFGCNMYNFSRARQNPIGTLKKSVKYRYTLGFGGKSFHLFITGGRIGQDHGRTKYGMATLFQIDQATFICRQWTN